MASTYLFDLDDTLIDSNIYSRMFQELMNQILFTQNIPADKLQAIITRVKKESGKEKADSYDICRELNCIDLYYKMLEKYLNHTYTMKSPAIPQIFKKLKSEGKKIAVISNSQQRTIEMFLKKFSLMDYVSFIESGKKSTIAFWLSLENKHAIYIEDTLVIDDNEKILNIAKELGFQTMHAKDVKMLLDEKKSG